MASSNYYERQIEQRQMDAVIASIAIEACKNCIEYKNEKSKRRITSRLYNMKKTDTKVSKKATIKSKIEKELGTAKNASNISRTKIVKEIEANLRHSGVDITKAYSIADSIAGKISLNSTSALSYYMSSYISAKQSLEDLKKQQAAAKKEEMGQKQEEIIKKAREQQKEQITRISNDPKYKPITQTKGKETPFAGITSEERKTKVKEALDKKINDKNGQTKFTYAEAEEIKKLYPELNNYMGYFSVDTLNKGIEIENIVNKEKVDVDDFIKLALLTREVMIKEVLSGPKIQDCELFDKVGISYSFDKYQKYYERFTKYYNSLSTDKKAEIDSILANNQAYQSNFGDLIATPETLKHSVNREVHQEITNHSSNYYRNIEELYSKTPHYTKYMDLEEVKRLYTGISSESRRLRTPGDNMQQHRIYDENLQKAYAISALDKIEKYSKAQKKLEPIKTMSPEEREKYHIKLAAICTEVFHEQPFASELQEVQYITDTKAKGEQLVETYETKKAAATRVYGMSKVKIALSKLTGKWQKYMMLMGKEELTAKEEETLSGMFK